MIDIQPPSIDPDIAEPGCSVAAARIVRRLHEAAEWQRIIDEVIELFGKVAGLPPGHPVSPARIARPGPRTVDRSLLGRRSVVVAGAARPTIDRAVDRQCGPAARRLAEEVRQGKMFAGQTREIEGFLRTGFRKPEDQVLPVGVGLRATATSGARSRSTTASSSGAGRRRRRRPLEIVALAIGDCHRALAVGRPCQRDHPPDHAAGLARRHHRHRRDRQHHRVQPGGRAHVRLQAQRDPRQGPARHDRAELLPQGLCDRRRIHDGPRRADGRPAHGDGDAERQRRDLSDRTDRDRDAGRRPPPVLRLDPRPARKAARRGGDQPAARTAAPEREDGGDGLAARRRLARTQQPAGGGGRAVDAAARIRARPADQAARREGPRRRRALRPHRQELPRHGAAASDRARPRPTSTARSALRSR